MAFWGIEVKPAKPFTHKFDESRGRLHVSMASLGLGSAVSKSVLQCNVGNKSPVFLCSLYPEKSESLQLNLEFEEVDEVVFSVVGPRSIHLSGYYLGLTARRYPTLNEEESESYGEDIADTDTQRSDYSDEDEYEDSFINDDDPGTFPPSPVDSGGEEQLDDNKRQNKKGNRRRLRKTYQLSESENEGCSQQKKNSNCSSVLASDNDDNCPISTFLKTGVNTKKCLQGGGENADNENDQASNKKAEDCGKYDTESRPKAGDLVLGGQPLRQSDLSVDGTLASKVGDDKVVTPRKKRKERNISEAKGDKTHLNEAKVDTGINAEGQIPHFADDTKLAQENDIRPKKKKRKEPKNEQKKIDVDSSQSVNDIKENQLGQVDAKEESRCEERKVKQKNKKNSEKVEENGEAVNLGRPQLQIEEKNTSSMDSRSDITSQAQTLQNGLVIEVLESGKPDGKVAVSGKKVCLRYVGTLKKTGEVFDSNVDHDVFKFRLGSGKVIDGWEVGLEGMRVGERRRLTIPPIMGYGGEGNGKNVPPDSWLVYEVELVKVR